LAQAYAAATATVYPSLYEGFGLPILESLAAGAPVIASDRGAMREVAGEAALLVDPLDPGSLAAAMLRLVEDPALHARLQNLGRERAAAFTWEKCAGAHLEAYRQLTPNLR
jgi:glycosyltransferase involved in cell wall biosynthesis